VFLLHLFLPYPVLLEGRTYWVSVFQARGHVPAKRTAVFPALQSGGQAWGPVSAGCTCFTLGDTELGACCVFISTDHFLWPSQWQLHLTTAVLNIITLCFNWLFFYIIGLSVFYLYELIVQRGFTVIRPHIQIICCDQIHPFCYSFLSPSRFFKTILILFCSHPCV
jgi:hypothetical protein